MKEKIPEFGVKRENEERRDGGCGIVFDPKSQKYAVGKHHNDGFLRLFSGGVDESEDKKEGILREVIEESGLYDFLHVEKVGEALTHYYNSLRKVNRLAHATCFLIVLNTTDTNTTALEEHENFSLHWATDNEMVTSWQSKNQDGDNDHWLYFMEKAIIRLQELGYNK